MACKRILTRVTEWIQLVLSKHFMQIFCLWNLDSRAQFEGRLVFNPSFFFLCSKAFSRIIFSVILRAPNHQLEDKKTRILNPVLNNLVQGFLNREYSSRTSRNPESQFNWQGIQNPVSGIRNPWRGIQNPRPSWIALHGAGYSSRLRISFPVWCSAAKRGKGGEGEEKKEIRKLFQIPSLFTFLPSPFRTYLKPRAHTILPSLHAISRASTYCWFSKHKSVFSPTRHLSPLPC